MMFVISINTVSSTADQYREELVRDAFTRNLSKASRIAYDKANSIDLAQKNAYSYSTYGAHTVVTSCTPQLSVLSDEFPALEDAYQRKSKSYFCGGLYHNRQIYPAP